VKKHEILLVIAGVLGFGWAITQIASLPYRDPMGIVYLPVILISFGLIYLGIKNHSG